MTKQIDIKELMPFMKDGYIFMTSGRAWLWCEKKPEVTLDGFWKINSMYHELSAFNIKPVSDWTKSLIKVENKDE